MFIFSTDFYVARIPHLHNIWTMMEQALLKLNYFLLEFWEWGSLLHKQERTPNFFYLKQPSHFSTHDDSTVKQPRDSLAPSHTTISSRTEEGRMGLRIDSSSLVSEQQKIIKSNKETATHQGSQLHIRYLTRFVKLYSEFTESLYSCLLGCGVG
jgi:hypothetical protein